MYSKSVHPKKGIIEQSIKDNSPVSKDLIAQIKEIYGIIEYNTATEYLFGDRYMIITELTIFQAKMLITHAELLGTLTKERRGKDITPMKNVKPYRNIWNTLEKRTR